MGTQGPDERVRRVRAALAEAGWPNVPVAPHDNGGVLIPSWLPTDIGWRAAAIAGAATKCWPCCEASGASPFVTCDHDPFDAPWPEVVR